MAVSLTFNTATPPCFLQCMFTVMVEIRAVYYASSTWLINQATSLTSHVSYTFFFSRFSASSFLIPRRNSQGAYAVSIDCLLLFCFNLNQYHLVQLNSTQHVLVEKNNLEIVFFFIFFLKLIIWSDWTIEPGHCWARGGLRGIPKREIKGFLLRSWDFFAETRYPFSYFPTQINQNDRYVVHY